MPNLGFTDETKEKMIFTYRSLYDINHEKYRKHVLNKRIP